MFPQSSRPESLGFPSYPVPLNTPPLRTLQQQQQQQQQQQHQGSPSLIAKLGRIAPRSMNQTANLHGGFNITKWAQCHDW